MAKKRGDWRSGVLFLVVESVLDSSEPGPVRKGRFGFSLGTPGEGAAVQDMLKRANERNGPGKIALTNQFNHSRDRCVRRATECPLQDIQ